MNQALENELAALITEGKTIPAIKRLREATGCDLAVALQWVDDYRVANVIIEKRPAKPCPHCAKPLRSGEANQCFECGMDWHDPKYIVQR